MSGTELIAWLGKDVLPGALKALGLDLMKRRRERATEILLDELSRHESTLGDVDDVDERVAIVFEYFEAVRRGTARQNLRLLAQVAAQELSAAPVHADDFLHWSRVLADLKYEELVTLAEFHRISMDPNMAGHSNWQVRETALRDALVGELKLFHNLDELELTLHSLARTGLVIPNANVGTGSSHGLVFRITPRLVKLMDIARIEDVFAEPRK